MAKYGVKYLNTPGKSELTILKIRFLTAPLSNDWRIFTKNIKQKQRTIRERINRRSPTPQSGQVIFANKNEQYRSGTWTNVPLSSLTFLYEQYLFKIEIFSLDSPNAIRSIAFRSSWD